MEFHCFTEASLYFNYQIISNRSLWLLITKYKILVYYQNKNLTHVQRGPLNSHGKCTENYANYLRMRIIQAYFTLRNITLWRVVARTIMRIIREVRISCTVYWVIMVGFLLKFACIVSYTLGHSTVQ